MVQTNVALSNQIFCILEEWETVLQGLNGNIFSEMPAPEFWAVHNSENHLKPDHFWSGFFVVYAPIFIGKLLEGLLITVCMKVVIPSIYVE